MKNPIQSLSGFNFHFLEAVHTTSRGLRVPCKLTMSQLGSSSLVGSHPNLRGKMRIGHGVTDRASFFLGRT